MTKITFHGELGEELGKTHTLKVRSVPEALHAIDIMSDSKLRKFFIDEKNRYKKYQIIVNGKVIPFPGVNKLQNSEVLLQNEKLKTVEFVPVLEGSGIFDSDWFMIFIGVIALAYAANPFSYMAAVSMIVAGISNLLSKPPDAPEQQQIANPSSDPTELANSYLFSGPVNVLNEGGPVPIGYGRLLVGSQVVMATYDVKRILTKDAGRRI